MDLAFILNPTEEVANKLVYTQYPVQATHTPNSKSCTNNYSSLQEKTPCKPIITAKHFATSPDGNTSYQMAKPKQLKNSPFNEHSQDSLQDELKKRANQACNASSRSLDENK